MPTVVEPHWRFLLAERDSSIVSFLDTLCLNLQVGVALNLPRTASGDVRSDSPQINRLSDDGYPALSFNDRLVYGLRLLDRGVYVPAFGGLCHITEDEAGTEAPRSHWSAWDPWKLLYGRPITHDDGTLPTNEWSFNGKRGNEVALQLVQNTHAFHGATFIDFGQTAFYGGTIENTAILPDGFGFDQATSVGQAWTKLCATGTMDLVLDPVYDPLDRPGIVAELSIYEKQGVNRYGAVFGWDRFPRNLVGISRLKDGTEMANKIKFYTATGRGGSLQSDAESIAHYGQWWAQDFSPDEDLPAAVDLVALAELLLRRNGKETLTVTPSPRRASWPFRDYNIGDCVPAYASSNLRQAIVSDPTLGCVPGGLKRIYGIPIRIENGSGIERVDSLLLGQPDGGLT